MVATVGDGPKNKHLPKLNVSPSREGGGVARAQTHQLIRHPTLPHLLFVSLGAMLNISVLSPLPGQWCVASRVGVCCGDLWGLGGDADEVLAVNIGLLKFTHTNTHTHTHTHTHAHTQDIPPPKKEILQLNYSLEQSKSQCLLKAVYFPGSVIQAGLNFQK
uniref:Uncharacterized protein n=1 Tax=Sus scrofa TaxID=9823 RepID=A0A8D1DQD9_PIG